MKFRSRWFGLLAASAAPLIASAAYACEAPVSVCDHRTPSSLSLIANGRAATVLVDADAILTVRDAADALAGDLARISGSSVSRIAVTPAPGPAVIVGVLGQSRLIDGLVASGKIDATDLAGRWEAYRQVVVDRPFPGVPRALVIVGADRRGAVFGAYDLSEKAGVSPWSWWADVPVRRHDTLYVTAGSRVDAPKVKYRGIFINDEDPAFGSWAKTRFGGVNAKAYAHVFDLILRLKGNYLWPAMWGKAIGLDDHASMPLADRKGIVLGTSHHEPMTRAQAEWHRGAAATVAGGAWDYTSNGANLRAFWRGGIERMMARNNGVLGDQGYEQLVTLGMRGDGDEPMTEGTATTLLETIVTDQRKIIAEVTRRPITLTPQVWALYKEVQDYYDRGMRVPDDVTLLFSDDNWGQIRRLPTEGSAPHAGGYGVYYHFDYVGGPRNYKWLNTNQIEKTWAQLDLAYRRGARQIWVVNVGDIKPMEYPIDFFLKMAWNPEAMTPAAVAAFPTAWADATFGPRLAADIAGLVTDYARLAARRKPELVDPDSFALGAVTANGLDGGEWGRMVADWDALDRRIAATRARLLPGQRDAYFQLVDYPVAAMANLYRLYYAVAWNRRLAAAGDPRANTFAATAERAFARDHALVEAYHTRAGGKWAGMMLQTKFGYTSWRDPPRDLMPGVNRVLGTPGPIRFYAAAPVRGNWAAVEATDFTRAHNTTGFQWTAIAHLGRTKGAIAPLPQGRPSTRVADGVRLDYDLALPRGGAATARLYMVPAIDTRARGGIRVGVSVDGGPVQVVCMDLQVDRPDWTRAVKDNGFPLEATLGPLAAGRHRVTLWRIDDGAWMQKLVLYTGTLPSDYLGPAASTPPKRS